MSADRDGRRLLWWARLAFALYLFFGLFLALGNLYVHAMGPCPAFSSNTDCYWSPAKAFWLFPGSQVAVVVTSLCFGLVLRRKTR